MSDERNFEAELLSEGLKILSEELNCGPNFYEIRARIAELKGASRSASGAAQDLEKLRKVQEVLGEAWTFVQKSNEEGATELYAYLEGAQENLGEVIESLQNSRRTGPHYHRDPNEPCWCNFPERESSGAASEVKK
jgi:hypothetical protein